MIETPGRRTSADHHITWDQLLAILIILGFLSLLTFFGRH